MSKTVIWTAGVDPSPACKWLVPETDRRGTSPHSERPPVPGHPDLFVVGDTASLDQDGKPSAGCCAGRVAARALCRKGDSPPDQSAKPAPGPFHFITDKGNMAVVGKGFAVLAERQGRAQRVVAWLAVVGGAPSVPYPIKPPRERLPAMGLDFFYRGEGCPF